MSIQRHWTDYRNVAIILDDEDTFGCGPAESYVALGPRFRDGEELDFEKCKNKIAISELLDVYFHYHSRGDHRDEARMLYRLMEEWRGFSTKPLPESNDRDWARFCDKIYKDWKITALAADDECPDKDDDESEYDDYVEENFCREVFDEESDENTILIELGRLRTKP